MTPSIQRGTISDMHAADVARFSSDINYLKKTVDDHVSDDKKMHETFFSELNTVKRLVWVQIGGIAALAWIVGTVGHDILKYLK